MDVQQTFGLTQATPWCPQQKNAGGLSCQAATSTLEGRKVAILKQPIHFNPISGMNDIGTILLCILHISSNIGAMLPGMYFLHSPFTQKIPLDEYEVLPGFPKQPRYSSNHIWHTVRNLTWPFPETPWKAQAFKALPLSVYNISTLVPVY